MDQVEWAALEHNYGSAADVPALLRGCADPDPGRSLAALADLRLRELTGSSDECVRTEDEELRATAATLAGGAG
jgi:hypothetical protein